MRRGTLSGVLAAAATAIALLSTATPAQAASLYIDAGPGWNSGRCLSGYLCAYQGMDRSGRGVGFYSDSWNWGGIPGQFRYINNSSRSWANRGVGSYASVWIFDHAGGWGVNRCLRPGLHTPYDGAMNSLPSANVWVYSCDPYPQFADQRPNW